KLVPNEKQIEVIENTLRVCRAVWNYALRERKDWINSRKCPVNACSLDKEYIIPADKPFPNYNNQAKQLTEVKKTNPWLKSVNAQVLQQVLSGYKTHRDIAAAEVIRDRGIENALGHSVSKNACGDDLTGALPSQKSVKQEILNASSRISRSS
ncbi:MULTISPECIES: helix-turn-helix domain-containing protein, partial [Spirulina sp. CCY15215]|uniref:helix-turn-helix domain-containing protein n=1 Tax=Spirulina sp. CCY15215 TaxID=2767591 RepID=UPI001952427E